MCARQQPIGKKLTSGLRGVWSCCWSGMCQVRLGRQSEGHFSRRACWSTHIKICASSRQRRTKKARRCTAARIDAFFGLRGGRCGSHIARSGQEPHTPGGTISALQVGGDPEKKKTAGPTLSGAARVRTLQDQECVTDWRRSPGKPRVPHCEERPGAAYSRRDQVSCGLAMMPRKTAGPTLRGAAKNRTHPGGTCACCGLVASL